MFGVLQDFLLSSCVIRVTAPQLSKFNTAIQLDQQLTAGDIVERFTSHSRSPVDGARLTVVSIPTVIEHFCLIHLRAPGYGWTL